MRKSFKVIVLGIFIIVTTMLICKPGGKAYEKKITFNSIDEIIEILNNNSLNVIDKSGRDVTNNIFSECLSKRKRICGNNLEYSRINLKYDEDKNTKDAQKQVINEYLRLCKKNLDGFKVCDKIEARIYDFERTYIYGNTDDKGEISIIFIDEGEGWVIDYFMINNLGEENQ